MTDVVLGVDGGNSKTIALVANLDGRIIGAGRAGCSDMYATGDVEIAAREVEVAAVRALEQAGAERDAIAAGAFSMAGADWPEDALEIDAALQTRGLARRRSVVNDAMGALRAGSPDGKGVVVVCGTGAAIGARSVDDKVWHSSWWQEPQGSRHLTSKALRAVYRAELGIDPPTALREPILKIYERESVEAVLHLFISRNETPPDRVADVTRVLLEAAQRGDPVAFVVVREHGASLGDYAQAAARRVGIDGSDFTLVLSGGVFRHPGTVLREALTERVRETSPGARPVMSRFEPAIGAVLLALEVAGRVVDETTIACVESSLPPPTLFET